MVLVSEYVDDHAFFPGPVDEFFDFLLVALEADLLPIVCAEEEAIEIAEAIVDNAGDLANVAVPLLAWLALAGLWPGHPSLRGWRDRAGVAAEALDSPAD
jgi:hypothetical protein